MPRCWVRCENTHVLMEMSDKNLIQEWHLVGTVMLRQIYDQLPGRWQVCWNEFNFSLYLGNYPSREEAMEKLEKVLDERRGYSAVTTQDPSSGNSSSC